MRVPRAPPLAPRAEEPLAAMDQPGPYVVVHTNLVVTAGEARASAVVERLAPGRFVNVVEVVYDDDGKKIRGRLEKPAGWITLLDQDRCLRGATPCPPSDAEPASGEGAPDGDSLAQAGGAAAPAAGTGPVVAAPPALVAVPVAPAAAAPAPLRSAGGPGKASERIRRLEAESHELAAATAVLKDEVAATLSRCAELQSRWADISGTSDDEMREVDEARRVAGVLRRAIEEKDARLAEALAEQERLGAENRAAESELGELEVAFRERLRRAVAQTEQRLLEEKASLRRASEAAESRLQAVGAEKAFLEQRALARGATCAGAEGSPGYDAMLEAHVAIAHAYGDLARVHPCLRCWDEPTLRITAALFKHSLFRRAFFALSTMFWLFALRAGTLTQSGHTVHI